MSETREVPVVVKHETNLVLPMVPNFIFYGASASTRRQDGFKELPKLDVADLPESTLRDIGAAWTEALLANAAKRRSSRSESPR